MTARPLVALALSLCLLVAASLSGCGDDDGGAVADSGPADTGICTGGTGCGEPCATGNSYGVGKYCTPGGGECSHETAIFCTVDVDPTAPAFCTRPCVDDSGCAEGASCYSEEPMGQKGCVPMVCLGP